MFNNELNLAGTPGSESVLLIAVHIMPGWAKILAPFSPKV